MNNKRSNSIIGFEYGIGEVFEIASKRSWKSKAYKWYEKTFRKSGGRLK